MDHSNAQLLENILEDVKEARSFSEAGELCPWDRSSWECLIEAIKELQQRLR